MIPLPNLDPAYMLFKGHDIPLSDLEQHGPVHVLEGHGRWIAGRHVILDMQRAGSFPVTVVWTSRPVFMVRLNIWYEDQIEEFILEADDLDEARNIVSHLDVGDVFSVEGQLHHPDDWRIYEMFVIPSSRSFHEHSMKPEIIVATSLEDARKQARKLHPDSATFHVIPQASWFPVHHLVQS
jgi:hypothetical protein